MHSKYSTLLLRSQCSGQHLSALLLSAAVSAHQQAVQPAVAVSRQLVTLQKTDVCCWHPPLDAQPVCPWLDCRVAVAEGPRSYDGGGVVEPPMGLPWRLTPAVLEAGAEGEGLGCL